MILSDRDIKRLLKEGKLKIQPLENPDKQIQAAWIDLTLGNEFKIFKALSYPFIDIAKVPKDYMETVKVEDQSPFFLQVREFALGSTREKISIPDDLAAYIDGRSSLGRLGVVVHITSGWVDPGFNGKLTLEITNVGKMPITLYPGMRIAKLVLFKLSSPAERPYYKRKDAKYHRQKEILQSKIDEEFKAN